MRNFIVCTVHLIIGSVIKSRILRWTGNVARMEEGRIAFKIVTGTLTVKRPFEKPRRRWEGNIRMHLTEIAINTRNWVDSAQDRDYWRAFVWSMRHGVN